MGWHFVLERRELSQPFLLFPAELLDGLPPVGPTDYRADRQKNDVRQRMKLVALDPRVLQRRKMFRDACGHEKLLRLFIAIVSYLSVMSQL
jgi:hypothetical protein